MKKTYFIVYLVFVIAMVLLIALVDSISDTTQLFLFSIIIVATSIYTFGTRKKS